MTERILIIEDDATLAKGLQRALSLEKREVCCCETLGKARSLLKGDNFDLVLLDVNLPDGNGCDFLEEMRKESDIPVIVLTANDMETDIVMGLELGADDHVTKPFSLAVLRARVNTQLRKRGGSIGAFRDGEYIFDFNKMEFYRGKEQAELSKTEQKLLRILTENAGLTVSRSELIDRTWTDGAEYVDENALNVAIKRLRDKLSAGEAIKTVYGIGYTWVKQNGEH